MRYIKGHIKRKLKNWVNKKWYHQGFDACPFFLHFIAEAEITYHQDRKQGCEFSVHYCFFKNDRADWYIAMDDINRICKLIISRSKNNLDISSDFIKLWQDDQTTFYKKCNEIEKLNLKKFSNHELIKLHDEFAEIILNKNSCSSIIDGFALGTDEFLAEEIRKAYEKSSLQKKFTEVFSILTAPIHLSFINEAEASLLGVALEIEKEGLKKAFLQKSYREIKIALQGTKSLLALKKHQKSFFWIRNNYVSWHVLDEDFFIRELKRLVEINLNVSEEIKKIEDTPKINEKNKIALMKNISLSQELKTLIKITEDFTYWQDERKKGTFWSMHYFSLILAEISKRVKIDIEDIKYMTWRELSPVFQQKLDVNVLKARRKNCVYFWDKEGFEALHSKSADKVRTAILGKTDLLEVNDFRGLTACIGKAIGMVKIVKSAKEIDKVEKGDILVAIMTRPDYIPAMKKASAIVTDEGGITCHAAIVSRELGIPCIIGTKIATKVLKDGQLVQVNANHGVVKIVGR